MPRRVARFVAEWAALSRPRASSLRHHNRSCETASQAGNHPRPGLPSKEQNVTIARCDRAARLSLGVALSAPTLSRFSIRPSCLDESTCIFRRLREQEANARILRALGSPEAAHLSIRVALRFPLMTQSRRCSVMGKGLKQLLNA